MRGLHVAAHVEEPGGVAAIKVARRTAGCGMGALRVCFIRIVMLGRSVGEAEAGKRLKA